MAIIGDSWFSMAAQRMDWAAGRQKVIAENVANSDTPGYVGRDVVSFAEHLSRAEGSARTAPDTEEASNSWGGSFDGNKVVIEEQMVLSNEASSSYQLAARLYTKGHELLVLSTSTN